MSKSFLGILKSVHVKRENPVLFLPPLPTRLIHTKEYFILCVLELSILQREINTKYRSTLGRIIVTRLNDSSVHIHVIPKGNKYSYDPVLSRTTQIPRK